MSDRPCNDAEARREAQLRKRLASGTDLATQLLDELGDTPIPGADTREVLRLKALLRRWAADVNKL